MLLSPLPYRFYERDTAQVARELLGKFLVRKERRRLTVGRIVEAEAYLACADPACHSARGKTRRNAAMFGPPGRAYVYAIHSRFCFNVVTEPEEVASAVLIRAVEPVEGIKLMQRRREVERLLDLARGPARLCEAFAIDRTLDGWDLTRGEGLWIAADGNGSGNGSKAGEIIATPRIGISSGQELLLRFALAGNRYVSGRRWLGARPALAE
jgi:DNA-3-methyladenine glycosylase